MDLMNSSVLEAFLTGAGIVRFGQFAWQLHSHHPHIAPAPFKVDFRGQRQTDKQVAFFAGCGLACCFHARTRYELNYFVGIPNVGQRIAEGVGWFWNSATEEGGERPKPLRIRKTGSHDSRILALDPTETYVANSKAILIDDVFSFADRKIEAIELLRSKDVEVTHVAVIVDHQLGGKERLEEIGVQSFSRLTIDQLLTAIANSQPSSKELQVAVESSHKWLKMVREKLGSPFVSA